VLGGVSCKSVCVVSRVRVWASIEPKAKSRLGQWLGSGRKQGMVCWGVDDETLDLRKERDTGRVLCGIG